jgi:hypothetical protein
MARIILIALLLSGCTTVAHITDTSGMEDRAPVNLCWYGQPEPQLNQVAVEFLDSLGIDATVQPLPPRYITEIEQAEVQGKAEFGPVTGSLDAPKERAALIFARVITECNIVVEYLPGTGASCMGAALIIGAPCYAGWTYAKRTTLDASMYIRVKTPGIMRHELTHALGCDHGEDEATCKAQVQYMKALLRAGDSR